MTSLRDTQRAFAAALFGASPRALDGLLREDGIDVANRIAVYANNSRIGFASALAATYPVIQRLAGAEWFAQHARRYQLRCPSRHGDLQYVGDRFAGYLQAELAGTPYEYFADVAGLEWACQEAMVAEDDDVLDPQSLAGVAAGDYDRIVLVPRSSLRLIESSFPLLKIWQANQTHDANCNAQVALDEGSVRLAVVRRENHIEMRSLTPDCFELLRQFKAGATLGAVAETAGQSGWESNFGMILCELFTMQVFARYHRS